MVIEMDNDIITIAIWIAVGAGLGLLIDSFLKGMYVPKHWHQVLPAFWALTGFYIWTKFKNDAGAFLGMVTFYALAFMHGRYIEKAGTLYQGYKTAIDTPDPKITLVDAQKTYPELQMVDRAKWKPVSSVNVSQQVVALPRFDMERQFAKTLIMMHEYKENDTEDNAVNMTEKKWVRPNKFKTRAEFVNMLRRWETRGVIERKSAAKNSPYIVRRWDAVELVANGNPIL